MNSIVWQTMGCGWCLRLQSGTGWEWAAPCKSLPEINRRSKSELLTFGNPPTLLTVTLSPPWQTVTLPRVTFSEGFIIYPLEYWQQFIKVLARNVLDKLTSNLSITQMHSGTFVTHTVDCSPTEEFHKIIFLKELFIQNGSRHSQLYGLEP